MKTIVLPIFGIVITLHEGGGSITSNMKEDDNITDVPDDELYNASCDGIESMILAHVVAGVDVESSAYLEGIVTAVASCGNHF